MNTLSQAASQMGKKGAKKSVESRFAHLSKEEISAVMRKVRSARNKVKK